MVHVLQTAQDVVLQKTTKKVTKTYNARAEEHGY